MNSAAKIILALLAVAAVAYGAMQLMESPPADPPPQYRIDDESEEGDGTIDAETGSEQADPVRVDTGAGARTDIGKDTVDTSNLPQGVRGRAVNEAGIPVVGAEVILRKVVPGGFIGQVVQMQKGMGNAPIATAVTDGTGEFALGIRSIPTETLELWFTSDSTIDRNIPQVKIVADTWKDMGNIELKRGATLFGQVTAEATGAPIEGARVAAKNPMIGGLAPPPGREDGVWTLTDANGVYRLENLQPGALMIQAVAEGFARGSNHDTRVNYEAPSEVNFKLAVGKTIGGVITDAEGQGIAGAQVSVVCLSTKTPMKVEVRTDGNGEFLALGLIDAPFQVNAMAPGYVRATEPLVEAGTDDAHIVLEKQGGARVKVVGANGRVLTSYYVAVWRHFAKNDQYGAAHDIPGRMVRSRDLDSDKAFQITGINAGDYAVVVETGNYAKTRSEPFTVTNGSADQLITVRMKQGGKIHGTVLGPEGTPLAGVEVETMPPGLIEVPFIKDLQHLMTTEITKTKTRTDAKGEYTLKNLAAGKYQLKFTHPSSFVKYVPDAEVGDEQITDIEIVRLEKGTRVHGTVLVDGRPGVGVKVSISTTPDPNVPVAKQRRFSAEALSNAEGKFEFPRRVPPGNYTLRAGRTQGNPLLVMLDYKKTEQQIVIAGNQDSFEYSPNIPSN